MKALQHKRDMDLIDDDTYYKELASHYRKYLKDYEETTDKLADVQKDLYSYYKDLYKEDRESRKTKLEDQIDDIEDFYDKQKELLENQWDEEEEKNERAEQAQNIAQIRQLIAELERDGSAAAKRQLIEAREELAEAEKERDEWEKEQAQEATLARLEEERAAAVDGIKTQVEKVEEELRNIDDNTSEIRSSVLSWARKQGYDVTGLATGTPSAVGGLYTTQERGAEALAYNLGAGRFTYLTPESKVWNAGATDVLYSFANSPSRFLSQYISGLRERYQQQSHTAVVSMGDIIIQGKADASTVAALRQEREKLAYSVLEQFKKLK